MMDEDQAWDDLERRIHAKRATEYVQRAQIEAARFIHEHKDELGMMTLRKAFELGYRFGFSDGIKDDK